MNPLEIVKTVIEAISISFKSATMVKDELVNDKNQENWKFIKWIYNSDSFNSINDKRKFFTEKIKDFCNDTGITSVYRKTKDIITSPNFGRLMIIAGTILSLALIPIFPVAPWVIGVSVGLTLTALVIGVGYEAYKKYNLSTIQKEDKALFEISKLEVQKIKNLDIARGIFNEENKAILELIEKELHKFNKPNNYQQKDHNTKFMNVIGNSLFNRTPDAFVPLICSIISLNPITISFACASLSLTYGQSLKQNYTYQSNKTDLLNNIENTKTALNLTYESNGNKILQDIIVLKKAEDVAVNTIVNKLTDAQSSGMPVDKDQLMKEFKKIKDKEFTENSQPKSNILVGVGKDYLKSMGKVLINGFSAEKSTEMFSPLNKHEEYKVDLNNNLNFINSRSVNIAQTKQHDHITNKDQWQRQVSRVTQTTKGF